MISRMKFFNMVQEYRIATGNDVSRYAVNTSYLALLQNEKTALVKRMEKVFCKNVDNQDLRAFLIKKPDADAAINRDTNKPKRAFSQVDYLGQDILLEVLDPDLNLPTKGATTKRAFNEGKLYMVMDCPRHGTAMYRTSIGTPKNGEGRDHYHYQKYCLLCKIGRQENQERADDIRTFLKNYLAFRERVNQSAS